MRKVKRILASLLVGAMLAGTMSSVAYAETAQTEKRWVLEDDGSWYYFKGDKMLKTVLLKKENRCMLFQMMVLCSPMN